MSGISKNLFLALTLVCVIVLIVFCIQLIVINRGLDPADSGSAISGGPGQDGEEDPDEEDPDGEDVGNLQVTPRPIPQGTRRELRVTLESNLVIYTDDEIFDFEEDDIGWGFVYTRGGVAALEITHLSLAPQGVAATAEAFLSNYTGGAEAEFNGDELIMGSQVRGYHVTARHDGEVYEAWIHMLLGSDLALAFVISYENDQQRDALYEVLSTLDFILVRDSDYVNPEPVAPPEDEDPEPDAPNDDADDAGDDDDDSDSGLGTRPGLDDLNRPADFDDDDD